jgi:glycosyltransferase involved in cell wall biosynthesis
VTLLGTVPFERMHEYYSAADLFVSGSHHEGSGYALIEALACGVTPCVSDIAAFRALTHGSGERWPVGDAAAAAAAIVRVARGLNDGTRATVRAYFDTRISWDVIGARTLAAYGALGESAQ